MTYSYKLWQYFLIVTIMMLMAVIIFWPMLDGKEDTKMNFIFFPKITLGGIKMEGVSLRSQDSRNRPFTVTSTTLERVEEKPNLTILGVVNATLDMKNDTYLHIQGKRGIADNKSHKIYLDEGVVVTYYDHVFQSQDATINMESGEVFTDSLTSGKGDDMEFSATKMIIMNKGQHISLQGKSNLVVK